MRRLIPGSGDADLDDLYLDLDFPEAPEDRPWVYLDMVASVDGAATVDGRTRDLGGEADRLAFSRLREWCDAILVGASTVRVEDYGPPRPREVSRVRRVDRGLVAVPPLVIVTRGARLDPAARVFSDPARRPTLLTVEDADEVHLGPLRPVADVVQAGVGSVDLGRGLRNLRADGVVRLLCEGGPSLNAQLIAAGLVDELFLTVSARIVGSTSLRIVEGDLVGTPVPVELAELREHDSELLLRYRFRR